MGDVWNGNIDLPDGSEVKGITLSTCQVASTLRLPGHALRFLSVVDTARIPLYLTAGPNLDVWAGSTETEQWFQSILLKDALGGGASQPTSGEDWWTCLKAQSPLGILVQVESYTREAPEPRITEILFYGTSAAPVSGGLPTPPASSHDDLQAGQDNGTVLRVHALPLSSELLGDLDALQLQPPCPEADDNGDIPNEIEVRYLPRRQDRLPDAPGSPKRNYDHNVFDEATERRKKARRKGGEGVAAAAAKVEEPRPGFLHRKSLSVDNKTSGEVQNNIQGSIDSSSHTVPRKLSRSPSVSGEIRPLSRRGPNEGPGRSSLSRVTSIIVVPEEPTIESRNKDALSRVVMAAMRMYGLHQRKRTVISGRGSSIPNVDANAGDADRAAEEAAKDEEYKQIYHQTFKGAVLALRNHITTIALHSQPDRLRDIVEKLLAIFCTDPLAEASSCEGPIDVLTAPSSRSRLSVPRSAQGKFSPFETAQLTASSLDTVGGAGPVIMSPAVRKQRS